VILEYRVLYPRQRGLDCPNLLKDIYAIPILFDHAADAPDLSFNPVEPFLQRFFINDHSCP
jgi:hypothetical protein